MKEKKQRKDQEVFDYNCFKSGDTLINVGVWSDGFSMKT